MGGWQAAGFQSNQKRHIGRFEWSAQTSIREEELISEFSQRRVWFGPLQPLGPPWKRFGTREFEGELPWYKLKNIHVFYHLDSTTNIWVLHNVSHIYKYKAVNFVFIFCEYQSAYVVVRLCLSSLQMVCADHYILLFCSFEKAKSCQISTISQCVLSCCQNLHNTCILSIGVGRLAHCLPGLYHCAAGQRCHRVFNQHVITVETRTM